MKVSFKSAIMLITLGLAFMDGEALAWSWHPTKTAPANANTAVITTEKQFPGNKPFEGVSAAASLANKNSQKIKKRTSSLQG